MEDSYVVTSSEDKVRESRSPLLSDARIQTSRKVGFSVYFSDVKYLLICKCWFKKAQVLPKPQCRITDGVPVYLPSYASSKLYCFDPEANVCERLVSLNGAVAGNQILSLMILGVVIPADF